MITLAPSSERWCPDAATTTLRLYVKNVNNALQVLAAREYLEREHPVLFCMLDSSCNDNDNE